MTTAECSNLLLHPWPLSDFSQVLRCRVTTLPRAPSPRSATWTPTSSVSASAPPYSGAAALNVRCFAGYPRGTCIHGNGRCRDLKRYIDPILYDIMSTTAASSRQAPRSYLPGNFIRFETERCQRWDTKRYSLWQFFLGELESRFSEPTPMPRQVPGRRLSWWCTTSSALPLRQSRCDSVIRSSLQHGICTLRRADVAISNALHVHMDCFVFQDG